jgi:hypothetical protein
LSAGSTAIRHDNSSAKFVKRLAASGTPVAVKRTAVEEVNKVKELSISDKENHIHTGEHGRTLLILFKFDYSLWLIEQSGVAATLKTHIRKVPASNLSPGHEIC